MMRPYPITKLHFDSTKILPCRKGDILIWVKDVSSLWDPNSRYDIADFWQMKDGEQVILTNRLDDVPISFTLHPTMVGGHSNINKMLQRLNFGYSPDTNSVNITNLSEVWKLNLADYIIWSGVNRPEATSGNIVDIFRFETGSLGAIQNHDYSLDQKPDIEPISSEHSQQIREALDFIKQMSVKRRGADEWKLGG